MNVLITNSQEDQSYLIARCLRTEADKIVLAMHGRNRIQRWSALAPWSRFVDRRYTAPEPSGDWWDGRIQAENSASEEDYVQRIEEICDRESITAVFPSFDPDIYVLSKNKPRLAERGVAVVGPNYDQLQIPMNKLRTIETARTAGFPCPLTLTPNGPDDLDDVVEELPPPWVIKPRFTAHGKRIRIVTQPDELKAVYAAVHQSQPNPMVQEHVPGYERQNYYVVIDRNLDVVSLFCPRVIRTRHRGVVVSTSACISSTTAPYLTELGELLRGLGYWGCLTVQTVLDPRDSRPKLMEINPRLGDHLWYRTELGANEPLAYLRMTLNQPLPAFDGFPEGVHIVDPIDDLRNLGDRVIETTIDRVRRAVGLTGRVPDYRRSESLSRLIASMRHSYFGGVNVAMAPYVRHLLSDPAPCMLRNVKVLAGLVRRRRYFSR